VAIAGCSAASPRPRPGGIADFESARDRYGSCWEVAQVYAGAESCRRTTRDVVDGNNALKVRAVVLTKSHAAAVQVSHPSRRCMFHAQPGSRPGAQHDASGLAPLREPAARMRAHTRRSS